MDRAQRTSSLPPSIYGFIPQTYAGPSVAALMEGASGGDLDPLDICVLSERPIGKSEVILNARVVGGLRMIDGGEADDKIIAVLHNDDVWGGVREIENLPPVLVERLRHYFSTYKTLPGEAPTVSVGEAYSRAHALKVIQAALADYTEEYGPDA